MQQWNMKKGELEKNKDRSEAFVLMLEIMDTFCVDYYCLLTSMQVIGKMK